MYKNYSRSHTLSCSTPSNKNPTTQAQIIETLDRHDSDWSLCLDRLTRYAGQVQIATLHKLIINIILIYTFPTKILSPKYFYPKDSYFQC